MPIKLISATEIRSGSNILIDDSPCVVKSIDLSKSGKHGASKCRIEAIGLLDDRKRVIAVPGHERFSVPLIEKRKGQVMAVGSEANIMDLESFETFNVAIPSDLKEMVKEGQQVEYWDVEGKKIIKRVVG